jgi:PAS domain S-box-containing protein
MIDNPIAILKRALEREKASRKQAEKILEEKSTELYYTNQQLTRLNKDLESLLTRTDSQLQGVFENIVDAYVIMDLNGKVLKMNDASLKLLGFKDDKVDFNLMKMVNPSDYSRVADSFKTLIKVGTLTNFEINIKTNLNQNKIVHINSSIIYDNNLPVAAQGIIRDITISRENELTVGVINDIAKSILGKLDIYEIAQEITNKIALFLDSKDCVIYLYHEEDNTLEQIAAYGDKLSQNNQVINKINLKKGQGIVGYVAKSGIPEIINNTRLDKRYIVDIVERKSEITVPIMIGDKVLGVIDSEHEFENFYTKKHLNMINGIAGIVAVQLKSAIDLRELKRAEEELIKSESRLASLILNLDTGVLLEDENRKIILTNNRFCEFFEIPVTPEQMVGQDCSKSADQSKGLFVNPDKFVENINSILENKETVLGEELTMTSGEIFERDFIPIYRNNEYKGHLWSYKNVTLRRKYRQSLETQRQKYRGIITNMNLGLIEVDNEDRVLMANQSLLEMSGYAEEEIIGKIASELLLVDKSKEIIKKENLKRTRGLLNSY